MKQEYDPTNAQAAAEKLLLQAHRARSEARYADARRDALEAISLCQKAGDRFTSARTLTMLGQIARDQQHIDAALSHYEEALRIFQEIGDADRVAHTVRHIGDIQRSCGRFEQAEACYNEALEFYRSSAQTRPLDLANAIRSLAILKSKLNATDAARLLWEEARELYETVNVPQGVAECIQQIADLDASVNESLS